VDGDHVVGLVEQHLCVICVYHVLVIMW